MRTKEDRIMVMLYVGGIKVADLANASMLIPELVAKNQTVEFRDESGTSLGTFKPERRMEPNEPIIPWEPDVTREEINRRIAEPGITYEEVRRRLGWE